MPTRFVAVPHSHQPNQQQQQQQQQRHHLSCLYGPSLPSPFLTGWLTLFFFSSVLSRRKVSFSIFASVTVSLSTVCSCVVIRRIIGGEVCGGMRHSPSTVLHRQFSLPNPAPPPAMYTLRPRIQQQQHQMPCGPSVQQRPSFHNQQGGVLGFPVSRHVRTRRQVYRPQLGATGFTTVADPSSVMMQSCSPSPVQQFPSTTN